MSWDKTKTMGTEKNVKKLRCINWKKEALERAYGYVLLKGN
jgi:hypothetical protein